MKIFISLLLLSFSIIGNAQEKNKTKLKSQILETACGQCQFGMPGDGCDLAVKIDNHFYFVKGSHIDDHGDAHATDGFCQTTRKAKVKGKIENNKFVVTRFKLLPKKEK